MLEAVLETVVALIALGMAAAMRPWQQLADRQLPGRDAPRLASPLWTPLLFTLVVLPWLWALPTLHKMPLQLQWSGACLVMLMLGWPLAMPTLALVGAIAWLLSPGLDAAEALRLVVWHGMLPATLAVLWGVLLRRLLGTRVFVYIFGRGFVGTVLSLFAASMLSAAMGHELPGVNEDLSAIARWLMAWGDAVVTGMACAICVAYRPQWLATWSDELYLK
ncbi:MAG: hypothetical protein LBI76_12860 [Comamonas sp.]|jgi:uncharacterized membrane protein|nr:hypothetical protein [Comamonas sp.]